VLLNKPWLNKLKWGDPVYIDELYQMFHKEVVDGSNTYVVGQDYEEMEEGDEEEDEEGEEEEEFDHSPMSISSRKSKRSVGSTTSTGHSPLKKKKAPASRGEKKSKNPLVRVLDQLATTYKGLVTGNLELQQERIETQKLEKVNEEQKVDAEIEKCQELAWQCVPHDSVEAYATSQIFQSKFYRRYFMTIPTAEGRKNFLHRWCKEHNMS